MLSKIALSPSDLNYQRIVEQLALEGKPLTFNNSGPSHASIVISTIFKYTKKIIRIYAKNLDGTISNIGDYQNELNEMVNRDIKIKLIIDELPKPFSEAFLILHDFSAKSKATIKFSSQEFRNGIAFHYNPNTHFIIGDEEKFRLEYDNFKHQALCGFNNLKISAQLISLFDEHFDGCTGVKLT